MLLVMNDIFYYFISINVHFCTRRFQSVCLADWNKETVKQEADVSLKGAPRSPLQTNKDALVSFSINSGFAVVAPAARRQARPV